MTTSRSRSNFRLVFHAYVFLHFLKTKTFGYIYIYIALKMKNKINKMRKQKKLYIYIREEAKYTLIIYESKVNILIGLVL